MKGDLAWVDRLKKGKPQKPTKGSIQNATTSQKPPRKDAKYMKDVMGVMEMLDKFEWVQKKNHRIIQREV